MGSPMARHLGRAGHEVTVYNRTAAKAEPLMTQHHQQMEEVKALLDTGNADPAEVGQKVIAAHATRPTCDNCHPAFAQSRHCSLPSFACLDLYQLG